MSPENLQSKEIAATLINHASSKSSKSGKSGAEIAEVFIVQKKNRSFEVADGALQTVNSSEEIGIGLRVYKSGVTGFSFGSMTTNTALEEMAESAMISLESSEPVEGVDINSSITHIDNSISEITSSIYDPEIAAISDEDAIRAAIEMEAAAMSKDSRIQRVRRPIVSLSVSDILLANSCGQFERYSSTLVSASLTAVAEEGDDAQVGHEYDVKRYFSDIDPEALGAGAAGMGLAMLGARMADTGPVPVVLSNMVAAELLEILSSSLIAENALKGKSMFAGKTGSRVASEIVSIVDNGLMERGTGSVPFDDEGTATTRTQLISNGTLKGFLHTRRSAKQMNEAPTGNGFRAGFKSVPSPGISNLYIEKGDKTPESFISNIANGFYVLEVMGLHTANPISGDFSVGATGMWIKDGQPVYAIRKSVLSGNIKDLFMKVTGVGNDLRFFGNVGSPALMVDNMSVSGN